MKVAFCPPPLLSTTTTTPLGQSSCCCQSIFYTFYLLGVVVEVAIGVGHVTRPKEKRPGSLKQQRWNLSMDGLSLSPLGFLSFFMYYFFTFCFLKEKGPPSPFQLFPFRPFGGEEEKSPPPAATAAQAPFSVHTYCLFLFGACFHRLFSFAPPTPTLLPSEKPLRRASCCSSFPVER